jgi:serine/threonine protein kinase
MQPPSSSPDAATAVDDFLRSVLRSGLLDRPALVAALRGVPRALRGDPEHLAAHLVRANALSAFQARKLLKGTFRGLVLGPFQLIAPLGRGGMGSVFLARDTRSEDLAALKILPPQRARAEDRHLARFEREMTMSRRVSHPHLAWARESGRVQGVYYIAMEFIPGRTLYRLVSDEGPLSVARAARLFAEAAAGLEHAHNQGLIHRDLKPSNIMVTPHDHAKVLDLGLALIEGEDVLDKTIVGGEGYIVGSMDYIAPEQTTDAAAVDRRSDVYALGCTLYFALTGRPPFPGGTNLEKMQRHRTAEPTSLATLNPRLPQGFVALVRKMMAKEPDERWPSAIAVEEELRRWTAGGPTLPLDRPGDAGYLQAVAALRSAEPTGETPTELSFADSTDERPAPRPRLRLSRGLVLVIAAAILFVAGFAMVAWALLAGARG